MGAFLGRSHPDATFGDSPASRIRPLCAPNVLSIAVASDIEALAQLTAERLRAGGTGLLEPLPLYLRRPDAVAPGPRKQVTSV